MTFGVIGGDRRQAELAELLRREGETVCTYGLGAWGTAGEGTLEQAASAKVVILPLPLCGPDGNLNCQGQTVSVETVFEKMGPGHLALAGQVPPDRRLAAERAGVELVDYFGREEMTVANAAITAEGAVQVAMEHLDRTLLGMNCLVLGFGRIGKLLAHRLRGMGANVTATARKAADLAWIRAYGFRALETDGLDGRLAGFDAVFNTVPAMVLSGELAEQLPEHCLCVDVASVPGIDPAAAERCGLCCVWARGLPGRLAPVGAAAVIRDAVRTILKERGDLN